ncbi:endoplasmic oxidoreductin-1 [Cymbomonas tetramitiformis]|uniref:Endoplasmic oxidoreductin-1 n=1 Tax=Cymbomonas tetramitiformis TaxID=36881 RepID=A0AAE0L3B6_9CHLO|nr:endoplasmic oxidoreductin-1 [Cymbomonas tetramitiformis]
MGYLFKLASVVAVIAVVFSIGSKLDFETSLSLQSIGYGNCESKIDESSDGLCTLTGLVDDCCCEYEAADRLNQEEVNPLLEQLIQLPFFRYFTVNLHCDCPFWPDDGMCALRDCSVCECEDNEIPSAWKKDADQVADCDQATQGRPEGLVDRTIGDTEVFGWVENDNPWTAENESNVDAIYVNLLLNPERYTGYQGEHAHRIWSAIYAENCFDDIDSANCDTCVCAERRVFFRLISGLHASISTHIAANYPTERDPWSGDVVSWGPSEVQFQERLGDHPERIENLYFVYLFVLRAVMKAGPYLRNAEYSTGDLEADKESRHLVERLLESESLRATCPVPFDEAMMWRGDEGPQLKEQLREHFQNISAVMDCVGCEKCKLWGKLQMLGLATSLKILFTVDPSDSAALGSTQKPALELERNEVIALINLMARLSESLKEVGMFMNRSLFNRDKNGILFPSAARSRGATGAATIRLSLPSAAHPTPPLAVMSGSVYKLFIITSPWA